MSRFTGRLQSPSLDPTTVLIDIEDGRLRIAAGRRRLGSWPLHKVRAERTTIYRFSLDIDGDEFEFYPDDPSTFANAVGVVVDLTETKGRFGLKARIEQQATQG